VDHGRVIASGSVRELTDGGAGAGTLRIEARPGLDLAGLRDALAAGLPDGGGAGTAPWIAAEAEPGVYTVTGPVDPSTVAAVTAWLADRGVLARSVTTGSRTLEDVFLDLTGRNLR
jgi:ABC-2 type transport system ATP-binding protein